MKILINYIYSFSNQIIGILVPFITIPYVSRILGAESLGIVSYTSSISTYFTLLASLGISIYGNRTIAYYKNDPKMLNKKFGEIVIIKLFSSILSLILFFIFINNFKSNYYEYFIIQAISIISVSLDISWFFIGLEEFKKSVLRNIFVKLSSCILIFLLVKNEQDLSLYIFILAISTFLGNISLWPYLSKYVKFPKLSEINLLEHISSLIAIFLSQLMSSTYMALNRIILEDQSTLSQIGFFDNADKFIRIVMTFIFAIGAVIFPRVAYSYHINDLDNVRKYLKLTFDLVNLVSFPAALGLLLISKPFSILFFGDKFDGIDLVINILSFQLILMGISSVIGNQLLIAINKPMGITISLSIAIIISGLCSLYLIPQYGAIGASYSVLLGELSITIIQIIYTNRFFKLGFVFSEFHKYFFSSLIMYSSCYFIQRSAIISFNNKLYEIIAYILLGSIFYLLAIKLFNASILKITNNIVRHRKI
ncbi:hypothetical protein B0187_03370 [Haemophilus paracuniculus]|uniref:Uncharacterized protein n=1 Tax=Haemophilus paracuniculus TaxID=734 RepID=A0A1T0AUJ9_9PAST|nr:oligosaccharide flippase family protein [Haemophilus paracuniculus]OOR99857.1 hypothetical protein B0187_03370 [Haemophilus paracuniculus]